MSDRGVLIKIFNDRKYGFVQRDRDGLILFLHKRALLAPDTFERLRVGDRLWFTETASVRGPRAEDVHPAD